MASSKITLFLLTSLLFALVLVLSASYDHSNESLNLDGVVEAKYGGPGYEYPENGNYGRGRGHRHPLRGGCSFGCCRAYRYSNGCRRCCSHANEKPDAQFADDVKN